MRLLKHTEVKAKGVPFSSPHLERLEAAGKFPRRIRLGTRTHRWVEADVDQWMAERFAASGAERPTTASARTNRSDADIVSKDELSTTATIP
jgi:prophage regulatory protein